MNDSHMPRTLALRRGFTLMEMLVTITIIAVAATLVAPAFNDDNRLRLIAASSVLCSDIELAQVMTMSYPDDPVIVRFDTASRKYWLAYAADPDVPILREGSGEAYEVVFGQGRALTASNVDISLTNLAGSTISFNPQGGLSDFTVTPTIQLARSGGTITLSIAPTTGTVTEIEASVTAAALAAAKK